MCDIWFTAEDNSSLGQVIVWPPHRLGYQGNGRKESRKSGGDPGKTNVTGQNSPHRPATTIRDGWVKPGINIIHSAKQAQVCRSGDGVVHGRGLRLQGGV